MIRGASLFYKDTNLAIKPLLSYSCKGFDFMWIDKAGRWHIPYKNSSAHKDCVAHGSRTHPTEYCKWNEYVPCECPCHYGWDPVYATTIADHRLITEEEFDGSERV